MSRAILAWVAIFLTICLIILLLSSSWVQFVLGSGAIGLVLYMLIGVPLTWMFFLFRGIYRGSSKWRKSREVSVGLIGVLLTVMIISGVTVAVMYRSDLMKYKFPCNAEGPPSWLDTQAFEVAKQNQTDEFVIALHSLSRERTHQESGLSDLVLTAQLEKSKDTKKELFELIEREQSRIDQRHLESLRTIKVAIDRRFRNECQSAYGYAYQTDQEPTLSVNRWVKYRFVE